MTSWFTYQGGVPSKKGTYDDPVSGYTVVSSWFFQDGNTFPLKPQDSPSPLGPTVTCRGRTCVQHPKGYGHNQGCWTGPSQWIRKMVVGSFKKIVDSQRIEFIPQVQSVVDPGVTGLWGMESSATFVRFPS